jgi:hypothetical protein
MVSSFLQKKKKNGFFSISSPSCVMLPTMIALLVEMAQFFQGQVVLHEHANTLENNGTSG